MSNMLKQFYREIWAWIQDGCPEHPVFKKYFAIWGNLEAWSGANPLLIKENNSLLLGVTADSYFPFDSTAENFVVESRYGSFYQNTKRLAFIKEHAK